MEILLIPNFNISESYQVRQSLGPFFPLNSSQFRLTGVERPLRYQKCRGNEVWRGLRQLRIKTKFPETISHKISYTNSSFYVK